MDEARSRPLVNTDRKRAEAGRGYTGQNILARRTADLERDDPTDEGGSA